MDAHKINIHGESIASMRNIEDEALDEVGEGIISTSGMAQGKPSIIGVTLAKFTSMNLPPRVNIMDPWLTEAGLCMIYASRGVGKTHFALEVMMAVACGGEFLSFRANKPSSVRYLDGEMPANVMQGRLAVIAKRMQPNSQMIQPLIITPDLQKNFFMPNLSVMEGQEKIRRYTD